MKYFLVIIMFFIMTYAVEVVIGGKGCNVREAPITTTGEQPKVVGTVKAGKVFTVLETHSDYYTVEVIKGEDKASTSDHVGKKGFMWAARVEREGGIGYIITEAVCLRATPKCEQNGTPLNPRDDPNYIASVKKGAKVRIIEVNVTWFKIKSGWVWAGLAKTR